MIVQIQINAIIGGINSLFLTTKEESSAVDPDCSKLLSKGFKNVVINNIKVGIEIADINASLLDFSSFLTISKYMVGVISVAVSPSINR